MDTSYIISKHTEIENSEMRAKANIIDAHTKLTIQAMVDELIYMLPYVNKEYQGKIINRICEIQTQIS
jgi:hypothetical protein